jgi:thymidylate kinase
MKNLFITLEGVDGTGKSTVTKLLAEAIGGVSISTPPISSKLERLLIEKSDDQSQKFKFYIDQLVKQQQQIENLLKDQHVVCDRYTHSTFAYNWEDHQPLPPSINNYIKNIKIPDYSFLLIADGVIREDRVKKREIITGKINIADHNYLIIERARGRFNKMDELISIDTNEKTPQDVCEELKSLVLKLK